mgnify:CR=1 FL=1
MSCNDNADVADSSSDRSGFVYLFSHVFMTDRFTGQSILKIGATRKHPIRRATELGISTGVPGDFTVAYYCAVPDAFMVEKATHQAFDDDRVDRGREFFSCSLDEAIAFIRHYVWENFHLVPREGGEWVNDGNKVSTYSRKNNEMTTPMAELFASFPDDGSPRSLTADEKVKIGLLRQGIVVL